MSKLNFSHSKIDMKTYRLNEAESLDWNLMLIANLEPRICPACKREIDDKGHCLCKASFGIRESKFDGLDYYEN